MRRDEAIERLAAAADELRSRFGVTELLLFGSVARNEAGPGSDVDLLVSFDPYPGVRAYLRLGDELETLLGCRVDLIRKEALRPELRESVMSEALRAA